MNQESSKSMLKKSLGRLLSLALVIAVIPGCKNTGGSNNNASSDGDEFVVGLAAPFTGDSSQFGTQIRMGVDLFTEQLNAAGGIDGRKLVISYADDAGKAEQAQTIATSLASDPSVLAVIGHFNSSCSLAGKGIYESAGMVQFSPASTNVEVTRGTDFTYRNIFTDAFQGHSLATYATQVLNKKNAAILYDNDDYGTGLRESFKQKAEELGLNIVSELAYNQNAPDFRSQLSTIQGVQPPPDILLIAGLYTQAANIARQARDIGMEVQFIGGDGVFSQQLINLGGDSVEGMYASCPFLFDLGGNKAQEFAEAFREKYNTEPDAWAALSYDAVAMICESFRQNGFSREAVLEYLKTINSPETAYSGVVGDTYFDEEGDCKRPVQIAQVKDGKFVAAEMQISPVGKPVSATELRGQDTSDNAESDQDAPVAETPAATPASTPEPTPESTPEPTPTPTPEPTPTPSPTATAIPDTPDSTDPEILPPGQASQPDPADAVTTGVQ